MTCPPYKIASAEIVDLPLIELCARTGKPLVISTGMATVAEIHAAVATARAAGNDQLIVLGCTASYPAPPQDSNLRGIPVIADAFDVVVGLSDHTLGIGVPVAAVALGACVIEKHVTLDRADGGVDSDFSLEPAELAALVTETERAWQALGAPRIGPRDSEREVLRVRRSLYVVADVARGDEVTRENVRSIRPSGGLPAGGDQDGPRPPLPGRGAQGHPVDLGHHLTSGGAGGRRHGAGRISTYPSVPFTRIR